MITRYIFYLLSCCFLCFKINSQGLTDEHSIERNNLGKSPRKLIQILIVIVISIGNFISGTTIPFGAVTLPRLVHNTTLKDTNDTTFTGWALLNLDESDQSLYASIPSFGMLLGSLSAGPLANIIGRKWSCIIGTCGSLTLSFSLIAFAPNVISLQAGRFFSGCGLGYATTISTLYLIEISTPDTRGLSGVIPALFGALGVLTCQILGAYITNWRILAGILGTVNIPFFIALLPCPESPTFLIHVRKIDEAQKVIQFIRGPNWNIDSEMNDLQNALLHTSSNSMRDLLWGGREIWSPLFISLGLMLFSQFSGISIILNYTVDIFTAAAGSSDQFLGTVCVGIALLLSNMCTLFLVSKMRRRTMLSVSSLGISFTLIVMGVYFHLKEIKHHSLDNISWLPLVDLMIYIFAFNLGYGALTWVTAAEILPSKIRSLATSLSVGFVCLISFLLTYTFGLLIGIIHIRGVFWLYGGLSLLGFLYILKFIPETKDKNEKEIQAHFKRKKESPQSAPLAVQETF
ncbi:facilitated trehalose transporter Tret1 isoform X2 [Lepeophtheirus salmonis]|uniref:facilitated trehalose transporter Tret1 isoform X2 n=1 Tax=Lepeophtheirus salmonis TaxID=72036 RepID=UPI001AE167EB|nr:facilitated trehalose transporter Tret1-like isoform X2 [Lepeophtheirus salmonis]